MQIEKKDTKVEKKENFSEVKFRGLQYNLFDDSVEIIAADTDIPKQETKHFLLDAIVKWQFDHAQPIGPVRLMDPSDREKCVADIMENFKNIVYQEKDGILMNVEQGIADAMANFREKYKFQDEWD